MAAKLVFLNHDKNFHVCLLVCEFNAILNFNYG